MTETNVAIDSDELDELDRIAKARDGNPWEYQAKYESAFGPKTTIAMITRIRELESKLAVSGKRAEAWKSAYEKFVEVADAEALGGSTQKARTESRLALFAARKLEAGR